MIKRTRSFALAVLVVNSAVAQSPLNETLDRLKSRDWMERASGINTLASNAEWMRSPIAKTALVDLLDHENHGASEPDSGFGVAGTELHAEYYARLLALVDSLVDSTDTRGVEVLAHSVYNSSS